MACITLCSTILPGSRIWDPDFTYEQEMARVFGLEALRMADADVLPYDYEEYGKEVAAYLDAAGKRAENKFGNHALDFNAVTWPRSTFRMREPRFLRSRRILREPWRA